MGLLCCHSHSIPELLWEMMSNPAAGWASSCIGTKRGNAKSMEDSQDQHEGMHFKHVFKKLEIKNPYAMALLPSTALTYRQPACGPTAKHQQHQPNANFKITHWSSAVRPSGMSWGAPSPTTLGQNHKQMCSEPKPSPIWAHGPASSHTTGISQN